MSAAKAPEVAVVVPLDDPRGDVVEHLRTWTHDQTLSRDRFQVVAAADGENPDFEQRVSRILAPHDALVVEPGAPLFGLYEAGTRAASAPVLLLTEAHCRADPGCLAAVARAFSADPGLGVASLEHRQHVTVGISQFSERWFERAFAAWDRLGWPRLNTTGVAIKSEAYALAGGLDPRLELFAPSWLSARMHDQGIRFVHVEDAVLTHELEHEMGYSLELGGSFARGECIVRSEQDAAFCERYFGPAGLWERRLAYRPEIAQPMVEALAAAARRSPRDAAWLSRELIARLPARVAGTAPRRAWERVTARLHQALAGARLVPFEARWHSYVSAQERTVRATQLRQIADRNGALPSLAPGESLGAERLDGIMAGAHGVEDADGRRFRWTEPVALVRLAPADGGVLRIDTGGLRGSSLDYLYGISVGDALLPPEAIIAEEGRIQVHLNAGSVPPGGEVVVISRPLVPSRAGSADTRRLGMPVVEIAFSPA